MADRNDQAKNRGDQGGSEENKGRKGGRATSTDTDMGSENEWDSMDE